jgi:hypothetical protein
MTARAWDSRFRGNDKDGEVAVPAWVSEFLCGLIVTGSVVEAVEEAGIAFETAWTYRKQYPEFAMYWDRAVRVHKRVMAGTDFLSAVAAEEASVH